MAKECLAMFFMRTPATNQFLCRAYLCQAQLMAPSSAENPVIAFVIIIFFIILCISIKSWIPTQHCACNPVLCHIRLYDLCSLQGQLEKAVVYLVKAITMAKENSRYHFLVYNASVIYWQFSRPFLKPKLVFWCNLCNYSIVSIHRHREWTCGYLFISAAMYTILYYFVALTLQISPIFSAELTSSCESSWWHRRQRLWMESPAYDVIVFTAATDPIFRHR